MKIVVFGNVGSGKTTVCNLLQKHIGYQYVCIDQMRVNYSDGSMEGEQRACEAFYENVRLTENKIIECLGIGKVTDQVFQILAEISQPLICLILLTSKEICLHRIENRVWNVPFWKPIDTVYALIDKVDQSLQTGQIYERWSTRTNTLILEENNARPEDLICIIQHVIDTINFNEYHE